jgi:hypothetical protein
MKRILQTAYALLAITIATALTSCGESNEPVIRDFSPVCIELYISDSQGNCLLDADAPGSILGSGISATYDGKEFQAIPCLQEEATPNAASSRYYLAELRGLCIRPTEYLLDSGEFVSHNTLWFGEFQGFENFDRTVTFHFPSAARDVDVRVVSRAQWAGDTPEWTLEYYLDGRLLTTEERIVPIKIVL